jgi:hypothetical protein
VDDVSGWKKGTCTPMYKEILNLEFFLGLMKEIDWLTALKW